MKESVQRKIFDILLKRGIENFIGVPDSTMKHFVDQGLKKKRIIIATREEEAIGIAAGMSLSKSPSLVFMQNAGFANSLSTITSLLQMYQIPTIFLISWRGYLKNDAPEHFKIGKIQPQLLKSLNLKSKILTEKYWPKECSWAINELKHGKCCALLIRRDFLD